MYYTVYKITCLKNDKIYIGVHKTENLDDSYLGSGRYITRAINKYGKENFKKEVLYIFNNPEEMFAKEKELVTEEFVKQRNNYNCKPGGTANFYYINNKKLNHKSNQHLLLSEKLKSDPKYAKQFSEKMSEVSSLRTIHAARTPEEKKFFAKKAAAARWEKYRCGG